MERLTSPKQMVLIRLNKILLMVKAFGFGSAEKVFGIHIFLKGWRLGITTYFPMLLEMYPDANYSKMCVFEIEKISASLNSLIKILENKD
jgi:hypothetical protein